MTYRTSYEVTADHLDADAARRARKLDQERRARTRAAISRARYRGTCSPCIFGSLDGSGNVGECYCAPTGEHGPAYTPAAEVLALPSGYTMRPVYTHSPWGSCSHAGIAVYHHGRHIGTARNKRAARSLARTHTTR